MKLKSLLIGSAAVMAVSTGGAKAADAIVMAEPEPMEYVRVCDVYGTGFFYIPGTETCMKIGGYYRVDINHQNAATADYNTIYLQVDDDGNYVAGGFFANVPRTTPQGYNVLARFAPTVDVRSETELGTLRGFAEVEISYGSSAATVDGFTFGTDTFAEFSAAAPLGSSYGSSVNLNHAFIELIGGSGTFRLGKGDLPWARFLGYGAPGFTSGGAYAFTTIYGNAIEASYTFVGSNGFSGIIALVDNTVNNTWATNVEGGVNWVQGWGSIGVMAGYDAVTGTWGAKGALRFNAPNGAFQAGLLAFYTSGAGSYNVTTGNTAGNAQTNWSVLAYARAQLTAKVNFGAHVQWFDNATWAFRGNVNFTPAENFLIRPEIGYSTGNNAWTGMVRFQRDIPPT